MFEIKKFGLIGENRTNIIETRIKVYDALLNARLINILVGRGGESDQCKKIPPTTVLP